MAGSDLNHIRGFSLVHTPSSSSDVKGSTLYLSSGLKVTSFFGTSDKLGPLAYEYRKRFQICSHKI